MTRVLHSELVSGFEWTIDRYHRAIELGLLNKEDRVELLLGDLIETVPIGEDHSATVEQLGEYFYERLGARYRLRSENPITLPNNSEPEPDFVIAKKPAKGERKQHPRAEEIHLLIEVAQHTIDKDRAVKGPIYATCGISEYWIINLNTREVEVHQQPDISSGRYRSVSVYGEGQSFVSEFLTEVLVNELLPHP